MKIIPPSHLVPFWTNPGNFNQFSKPKFATSLFTACCILSRLSHVSHQSHQYHRSHRLLDSSFCFSGQKQSVYFLPIHDDMARD